MDSSVCWRPALGRLSQVAVVGTTLRRLPGGAPKLSALHAWESRGRGLLGGTCRAAGADARKDGTALPGASHRAVPAWISSHLRSWANLSSSRAPAGPPPGWASAEQLALSAVEPASAASHIGRARKALWMPWTMAHPTTRLLAATYK